MLHPINRRMLIEYVAIFFAVWAIGGVYCMFQYDLIHMAWWKAFLLAGPFIWIYLVGKWMESWFR